MQTKKLFHRKILKFTKYLLFSLGELQHTNVFILFIQFWKTPQRLHIVCLQFDMNSIDQIIRKVLTGEATPEEIKILEAWLRKSDANQKTYAHLEKTWKESPKYQHVKNEEALIQSIWQKGMEKTSGAKPTPHRTLNFNYWLKIAAIVVFIISIGVYSLTQLRQEPAKFVAALKYIQKSNPAGQKSKLYLPDGSAVWLNAESSIEYLENFSDTSRLIHLTGEAFFEVAEDSLRPFKVITGETSTVALGTSFNIEAYPDEAFVNISLVTGKVDVKVQEKTAIKNFKISPGEGIHYDKENAIAHQNVVDVHEVLAWKDWTLIFENDDFEEVTKKLSRWYGVQINVQGTPPEDWELTGRFVNQPLPTVLDEIRYGRSFDYTLKNKTLIINFP